MTTLVAPSALSAATMACAVELEGTPPISVMVPLKVGRTGHGFAVRA